jgi:hypothetical protein
LNRQSTTIKVNKYRIIIFKKADKRLKSYNMDKNNKNANANQRSNDEE